MEKVSIVGLDLAKNTIQVHGAAADGSVIFRRKVSNGKLLEFLSGINPCTVAMEGKRPVRPSDEEFGDSTAGIHRSG